MSIEQIKMVLKKKCIDIMGPAPWDIEEIAAAVEELSARYRVDAELALAQGILESHWCCNPQAWRSAKTRNIFNVGNTDSGANIFFESWIAGIDRYFRLMAREYRWPGEGPAVTYEMMERHDFTRPRGGRYATAPNYTRDIGSIVKSIRAMLTGAQAPKPETVPEAEAAKADKTKTQKTGSRTKPGMTKGKK
jgi:flagellum-specific peptidoglycan hydrolase FlgJ